MSVRIVRHIIDKQRAVEIVDLEDDHGRKHQIQPGILDGTDVEAFIAREIALFEEQEAAISAHIEKRFAAGTLERKP